MQRDHFLYQRSVINMHYLVRVMIPTYLSNVIKGPQHAAAVGFYTYLSYTSCIMQKRVWRSLLLYLKKAWPSIGLYSVVFNDCCPPFQQSWGRVYNCTWIPGSTRSGHWFATYWHWFHNSEYRSVEECDTSCTPFSCLFILNNGKGSVN